MPGRVFRPLLVAFGVVTTALGAWWVLQGTGVVPIGFMAYHMQWAWRGLVLAAMGVALAVIGLRMRQ